MKEWQVLYRPTSLFNTKLASQFWDLRIRPNKHCFTPRGYLHSRSRQFAYKTLVTSQWPRNAFMYMACAYTMAIVTCTITLYGLTKHEKYEYIIVITCRLISISSLSTPSPTSLHACTLKVNNDP